MRIRTASSLGLLLRAARVERGWSQADLARAARTTQKQVSLVEHGRPRTTIELVLRLMTVLKVDLEGRTASDVKPDPSAINRLIDEAADRGRHR